MSKTLAGPLLLLALVTSHVALAARAQSREQRIPRQSAPGTAIQGIVRTEGGLGLGGVAVILQDLASGKSFPTTTTGDGAFRFVNLKSGRYQVKATRDGFEPFARGDIQVAAGEVFPLEFIMKEISSASDGSRHVPRQPGLGPGPPALPAEPAPSSPYRDLLHEPPPPATGEPRPLLPLPPRRRRCST